jgi:hypothetical protein
MRKPSGGQLFFWFLSGILAVGLVWLASSQVLCSTAEAFSWQAADLRSLQPPSTDQTGYPVAAYARRRAWGTEIRVDLDRALPDQPFTLNLEMNVSLASPATLQTNTECGPANQWKKSFVLTSTAAVPTQAAAMSAQPILLQDADLGILVIRIPRVYPRTAACTLWFQVTVSAAPGSPGASIGPFALDGTSPGQARVYFAFQDVLPSATPAQTLRRWSGAHTGPFGQRHGLRSLLEVSQAYQIPLFLLDLRKPESLAGLDAVGGWSLVANNPLLTLPALAYSDPAAALEAQEQVQATSAAFGLPASDFYFGNHPPASARTIFTSSIPTGHIQQLNEVKLLPLPSPESASLFAPTRTGIGTDLQQALIQAALHGDPGEAIALGGRLPESGWGDQIAAQAGFAWLRSRPWVQILGPEELASLPVISAGENALVESSDPVAMLPAPVNSQQQPYPGFASLRAYQNHLLAELRAAPASKLRTAAWQAYLHLTTPEPDQKLQSLLGNDLAVVAHLLAANRWAQQPGAQDACQQDIDADGLEECILSNQRYFFILEPDGGRIAFGARLVSGEAQQIIGPLSQFGPGLSDPSTWKPETGPAGDPSEIPGAFVDAAAPFQMYQVSVSNDTVTFDGTDKAIHKSYTLTTRSITANIQADQPYNTAILLTLSPELRTSPGWHDLFFFHTGASKWGWNQFNVPGLTLTASAPLQSLYSSLDSRVALHSLESPDLAYPEGHYLPYPLVKLTLSPAQQLTVELAP